MLVLARKQNESIIIGDNIKIKILGVNGNTVRIGIEAPREVKVLRGELAPYEVSLDISQIRGLSWFNDKWDSQDW